MSLYSLPTIHAFLDTFRLLNSTTAFSHLTFPVESERDPAYQEYFEGPILGEVLRPKKMEKVCGEAADVSYPATVMAQAVAVPVEAMAVARVDARPLAQGVPLEEDMKRQNTRQEGVGTDRAAGSSVPPLRSQPVPVRMSQSAPVHDSGRELVDWERGQARVSTVLGRQTVQRELDDIARVSEDPSIRDDPDDIGMAARHNRYDCSLWPSLPFTRTS